MKIHLALSLALALFTAACTEQVPDAPPTDPAGREAYTLEESVSVLTDEPTDEQLTMRVNCSPDGVLCCTENLFCCVFTGGDAQCFDWGI